MINTNFKAIDSVFLDSKFPVEECNIPDKKYLQLLNSTKKYMCLIIDKRFPNERVIKIMMPYTWDEDGLSYAWVDKDGNWIDNFENPVHGFGYSDEFVIGWIPYDCQEDDEHLQNLIKKLNE